MNTYREKFLEAEERVTDLAEQLALLKKETEHYSGASKSLSETQDKLSELINNIDELVSRIGSTVKTLREIGTEEIMARIEGFQNGVSDSFVMAAELDGKTHAETRKLQVLLFIALALMVGVGILVIIMR